MSEKTIFKKIIDREIPAHILYEDDHFLVFLDAFPKNPGHTLVIPKQETLWVWDVDRYDDYFKLVRKMARVLQKAFDIDMILMLVHGEEVPHAHVHLRPQIDNDGTEKDFEIIAQKIKAFM
ncbi:MAG: HIT domain-containing protein [Candidatus Pacebacteria bacterium]|nr:HIT domain-containing protein [Candidatus Paceibacterota bacterium]